MQAAYTYFKMLSINVYYDFSVTTLGKIVNDISKQIRKKWVQNTTWIKYNDVATHAKILCFQKLVSKLQVLLAYQN